jgi:hypothetical protein
VRFGVSSFWHVASQYAGFAMGVFVRTQIAIVDGDWNVRVNRTSDLQEYISYDRAMNLADALEAEGWKECAAQIRKDAATVRRSLPGSST